MPIQVGELLGDGWVGLGRLGHTKAARNSCRKSSFSVGMWNLDELGMLTIWKKLQSPTITITNRRHPSSTPTQPVAGCSQQAVAGVQCRNGLLMLVSRGVQDVPIHRFKKGPL